MEANAARYICQSKNLAIFGHQILTSPLGSSALRPSPYHRVRPLFRPKIVLAAAPKAFVEAAAILAVFIVNLVVDCILAATLTATLEVAPDCTLETTLEATLDATADALLEAAVDITLEATTEAVFPM